MPPVYKLHYFNARGRAEYIRMCFVAGGVKYEDIRYSFEEWQKKKEEGLSPMGVLPMLEVDDKKLCESMAVTKYVARECGLSPACSFEVAKCDWIVDAVSDILIKMVGAHLEKDEERKKTLKEAFNNTQLPNFLTKMTALLKSNNGGTGFFVSNKLTYADTTIFVFLANFASVLEKYPDLKAHSQRIGEIPAIKKWIKNRPDTPM